MFDRSPIHSTPKSYQTWNSLGPINLQSLKILPFNMQLQEDGINDQQFNYQGQTDDEQIPNGIGRKNYQTGEILEGQYQNGEIDGFGRCIYIDGSYYQGQFQNGQHHGQGILVRDEIQQGIFHQGLFVNQQDLQKDKNQN